MKARRTFLSLLVILTCATIFFIGCSSGGGSSPTPPKEIKEIYVGNGGDPTNSITVYSITANGNTAPLRTISGTNPAFNYMLNIAVDKKNDEIIVTDFMDNAIKVFDRTDNGNIVPLRTIQGV